MLTRSDWEQLTSEGRKADTFGHGPTRGEGVIRRYAVPAFGGIKRPFALRELVTDRNADTIGARHQCSGKDRFLILMKESSALRSAPGKVWRYCWAVVICRCPRRSMTEARSAPPASNQLA
jgi:hypothetical protein